MPADPLGEIKIIKRLDTIDTGGNCLDLDVDIIDNVLVAVANYNGYFIYKINYNNNTIDSLIESVHLGPDDLDADLGDNKIESIVLSKENDIAFDFKNYIQKFDDRVFYESFSETEVQEIPKDTSLFLDSVIGEIKKKSGDTK